MKFKTTDQNKFLLESFIEKLKPKCQTWKNKSRLRDFIESSIDKNK